ncbi:MAG: transcriptional repressor [Patescibacteria group bacterium]
MDQIYKIFQGKSIKLTTQRKAIARIFLGKHCPPQDAESVFKGLQGKADKATVFRNLEIFESAGILRKVDLQKDSVHYELNANHHHHAVCTSCGLIEAVKCTFRKLDLSKFREIKDHSMEFFGICKSCAKG